MRHITYCRLCRATCGLLIELEEGRDATVSGDHEHALTKSFTCGKGRRIVDFHTDVVASICGVDPTDLIAAARMFGEARSGVATSGTGPDMTPWANVAEHLIQCMNIVCGRFPQAGDAPAGAAILGSGKPPRAEVVGPNRTWETGLSKRLGLRVTAGAVAGRQFGRRNHPPPTRPFASARGVGRKPCRRDPGPATGRRCARCTRFAGDGRSVPIGDRKPGPLRHRARDAP